MPAIFLFTVIRNQKPARFEPSNERKQIPGNHNITTFVETDYTLPNEDTVIGIGADYDMQTYQNFVGSLRSNGFNGNIILGISDEYHLKLASGKKDILGSTTTGLLSYFQEQNVTIRIIKTIPCLNESHRTCLRENPNVQPELASIILVKKWLRKCKNCNELIMMASIPNSHFQSVPFDYESDANRLTTGSKHVVHLFEMPLTTENWRVASLLYQCKKFKWDVPLLSSSIIVGSRIATLFYLETFIGEIYEWEQNENCRSELPGKGMAIHNYLFYNGDYRAIVHEYEKSSGLISFATSAELTKLTVNGFSKCPSPIVVSMDGPLAADRPMLGPFDTNPLRSMPMEYYSLLDRKGLSRWLHDNDQTLRY